MSDQTNKEEKWVEDLSLEEAMKHLDERERYIIKLRFFQGRTQMEVAKEIRISQAQVSRLEKNALKTMRQYLIVRAGVIFGIAFLTVSYYDICRRNLYNESLYI